MVKKSQRHHARSLLGQELPPRRAAPPGSWPEAAAAKQLSDRRGRYASSESTAVVEPQRREMPGRNVESGALVLSPKDTQFVTEHDDLEILGGLALAIWDQQPEQHPNHQVHER